MTWNTKKDRNRFKKLTYPHMKLLYNVALKYTGNVFDAEDIVQETYMMAFHKFSQLKDPAKCKPWLLRILRNNFLKSCQKDNARQQLQKSDYIAVLKEETQHTGADTLLEQAADVRTVNDAIDHLPLKYKEILILYYMEDMLYKDIASTLDIPIGTVMSRLNRAKEALKAKLLRQLKNSRENIPHMNSNPEHT
ncbi:MAG TPA: sigma-70 family RNA polymerase sigma factor [Desulfotignum sp.]|nr:sigma-70 family RNA polymerase sigma factor [Desulfotignum sp.]